jgi:hypothetical protein
VSWGFNRRDEPSPSRQRAAQTKQAGLAMTWGVWSLRGFTLYVEQWERLLNFADQVRQFMKEHDAELKRKGT